MKINFKQALVPLAVMVFGAAAAFTTNAAKQSDKAQAKITGYYYDHNDMVTNRCKPIEVECGDVINIICTDSSVGQVWKYDTETLTGCSELLYLNF